MYIQAAFYLFVCEPVWFFWHAQLFCSRQKRLLQQQFSFFFLELVRTTCYRAAELSLSIRTQRERERWTVCCWWVFVYSVKLHSFDYIPMKTLPVLLLRFTCNLQFLTRQTRAFLIPTVLYIQTFPVCIDNMKRRIIIIPQKTTTKRCWAAQQRNQ